MNKVLLYIDSMQKGGAQRVMSVIAEYLIKSNIEVTLVNDIMPVSEAPEYLIPQKIKRIYLNEGETKLNNLHRIRKLRRIIAEGGYQCAVSFLGPPNIRFLTASIGLRIRKIVSVRNDPAKEYGTGIKGFLLKQFFRIASLVVFQTEEASRFFPRSVQARSVVIPNPVDDKFFQVNWTGEGTDIIAVGRLHPQKNYSLLIKAYAKIAPRFPDTDLIICGDGVLRNELEVLTRQIGISNRVHFHGIVDDIRAELMKAGAFVMSSDYEGMPNALMEAMAVGVPVISTDCPCGGPKSLIQNKDQGILVECNNSEELEEAMIRVLTSKGLCTKLSVGERKRAKAFKSETVCKMWDQIIFERKQ